MTNINAKAPNIKRDVLYMCKWERNHKGQTERFLILILPVKYMLLDLNFINPLIRVLGNNVWIGMY